MYHFISGLRDHPGFGDGSRPLRARPDPEVLCPVDPQVGRALQGQRSPPQEVGIEEIGIEEEKTKPKHFEPFLCTSLSSVPF